MIPELKLRLPSEEYNCGLNVRLSKLKTN
jgi:hypothetical protein